MTRYLISSGLYDLDVLVPEDADLDGTFDAIDVESGDTLRINGWMIESIEEVEEVAA